MATMVNISSDIEKKRVASPNANANAPTISKNVAMPQLMSGGSKLNGNGKIKLANQLLPCSFSKPASPNSQASMSLKNNEGSHFGKPYMALWICISALGARILLAGLVRKYL